MQIESNQLVLKTDCGIFVDPTAQLPRGCLPALMKVGGRRSRAANEEWQRVRSAIRMLRYLAAVMNRDVAD
jgi:hypothetical protein